LRRTLNWFYKKHQLFGSDYLISVGITDKNVTRVRDVDSVWIFADRVSPNLPQELPFGTDDNNTMTLFDLKKTFLVAIND
jgi:hypothetical protein